MSDPKPEHMQVVVPAGLVNACAEDARATMHELGYMIARFASAQELAKADALDMRIEAEEVCASVARVVIGRTLVTLIAEGWVIERPGEPKK